MADRSLLDRLFSGIGWSRLVVVADVLAVLRGARVRPHRRPRPVVAEEGTTLLWLYGPVVLGVLALRGMYHENLKLRTLDEIMRIVAATSLAAMLIIAGGALFTDGNAARLTARVWLFAGFYLVGVRLVLQLTRQTLRATRRIGETALIVGAGRVGAAVERRLEEQPEIGLRPIGFLDHDPRAGGGRHPHRAGARRARPSSPRSPRKPAPAT